MSVEVVSIQGKEPRTEGEIIKFHPESHRTFLSPKELREIGEFLIETSYKIACDYDARGELKQERR